MPKPSEPTPATKPSSAETPVSLPQKRPVWAWGLIAICLLIPLAAWSMNLLVLGVIGLGASLSIFNIAGSGERTPKARSNACLMVAGFAWVGFVALVAAIQAMR